MNIAAILREQTTLRPDTPAIIDGRGTRRVLSFAELDQASARAANFLQDRGLKPGDAVLVFQPMSQELYVALIALFRLGCIATFLDPSAGRRHIDACCAIHPPRALIASSKAHLLRLLSPSLRRVPLKFSIGWPVPGAASWGRVANYEPLQEIVAVEAGAPALLTFTSGSTGQPKAALRSHGFLQAQHRALSSTLCLQSGTVDLTTLPIFLLSNLASGVTSLIPDVDLRKPGAIDAATLWAQIEREAPASVGASPALLERLAEYSSAHGQTLNGFEKIFTGGAPVLPSLMTQLKAMAPAATVTAVYGSTEAEPIAHAELDRTLENEISHMRQGGGLPVGEPIESIHLRILPDRWGEVINPFTSVEFDAVALAAGQTGEIVVSGDHVLPGYLNGQGDEETKFDVEGTRWHRTGDAGYLDRHGRLWLMGRCSARIDDAHGMLYPFAVECAALDDGRIRRAALVRLNGQRVLAVELRDRDTPLDLAALKETLSWAHIAAIKVLPRIPVDKRHNAKIDYPELQRMLEM